MILMNPLLEQLEYKQTLQPISLFCTLTFRTQCVKQQKWMITLLLGLTPRGGGYFGVNGIGMTVGNPRKLP